MLALGERESERDGRALVKSPIKTFFGTGSVWLSSAELAITAVSSVLTFILVQGIQNRELESVLLSYS